MQTDNSTRNSKSRYIIPMKASSTHYNNLEVQRVGDIQVIKKQEGSIEMTFDLGGLKQFYTLLAAGKGFEGFNETNIYVNGDLIGVYLTYHNERVLDLGAFSNESVTIKIEFLVPETQLMQELSYALNITSFEQRINEIKTQSLHVSSWSDTSIKGEIDVKKTDTLFLSIPYDRGWKVNVDEKTVKVKRLGGFKGGICKRDITVLNYHIPLLDSKSDV